jgi:quercetin dioxygenase-like cupin family protein
MSTATQERRYWWQGALMTIKASSTQTGGALGLVEAEFPGDFGPPQHVHSREDEAFYVLEGEIRFRRGDGEVVGRPGDWVYGPRGVPHSFKTGTDGARALVLVMPGGFEEMFADGGVAAADGSTPPPPAPYDPQAAAALARKYGFEFVGSPER